MTGPEQRAADVQAEGPPEPEFTPGIAAGLPRKRVAAGALVRDPAGRVLFVVPAYKPGLEIPGGIVEADESPREACRREVREELGLDLTLGRLLVVDWVPAAGVWPDGLLFVFDGGRLDPADLPPHDLPPHDPVQAGELLGRQFLTLADAQAQLRPSQARRLAAAVRAADDLDHPDGYPPVYLEFGRP